MEKKRIDDLKIKINKQLNDEYIKAENEKYELKKYYKINILLTNKNLKYLKFQKKDIYSKIIPEYCDQDPESVPYHIRLFPCYILPGLWAVLHSKNKKEFKIVVVYKLIYDSHSGDVRSCTVRDMNGLEEETVVSDRIFQIDWPPGQCFIFKENVSWKMFFLYSTA